MVDPRLEGRLVEPWIFDTGPLSHFARAGWLGFLKLVAGEHPVVIPDVVHDELKAGMPRYPHLILVLEATSSWITVKPIDDIAGVEAFATFSSFLVGNDGTSNVGECGVLALAQTLPAVAIIDDGAARKVAQRHDVAHRGTLGLLLEAVRSHGLSRDAAGAVADDILATAYRYPFESGRFIGWAVDKGHLEAE